MANINVYGTLNTMAEDQILAKAAQVFDDNLQKSQQTINSEIRTNYANIEDRFPYKSSIAELQGSVTSMTKATIDGTNKVIISSTDTARYTYWSFYPIPKGTMIYFNQIRSTNGTVKYAYCVNNPSDFYLSHSSTIVGLALTEIVYDGTNKKNHEFYYVMPEDGYVLWSYTTTNTTTNIQKYYDPSLIVTEDERIEYITNVFPQTTGTLYFGGFNSQSNVTLSIYSKTAITQSASGWGTLWLSQIIPKGTIIHIVAQYSTAHSIVVGVSHNNPQDYYDENGTILGFQYDDILYYQTLKVNDQFIVMPYDGYFLTHRCTSNVTVAYAPYFYPINAFKDVYTNYYTKGVEDGSAMASIAGLGYDITEMTTFARNNRVSLNGFQYGVDLKESSTVTPITGTRTFYADSNLVYFPKVDVSGITRVSGGGANSDAATAKAFISNNANLVTLPPDLNFPNIISSAQRFISNCPKLKKVGTLGQIKLNYGQYFVYNNESLEVIGDISTNTETLYSWMSAFRACAKLHRIEGLSYKAMSGWYQSSATTLFHSTNALRYLLIKDIGYKNLTQTSQANTLNFTGLSVWGAPNDADPDALQSLIDSLITYSYDRATDPDNVGTVGVSYIIRLHANTLARLTEDQKTAITAKGFTLTT